MIRRRNMLEGDRDEEGKLRKNSLSTEEVVDTDSYVKCICESISSLWRRNIILTLDTRGECSFTRIAKEVGISSTPKLSFHLGTLKSYGVVEKNGGKNTFSLN